MFCCDTAAAPGKGFSKTWLSQGLQDQGNLFPLPGCAGLQPSALRLLRGADVSQPRGQEEPLEKNWGALFRFFSPPSCMEMATGCLYQEISSLEAVFI